MLGVSDSAYNTASEVIPFITSIGCVAAGAALQYSAVKNAFSGAEAVNNFNKNNAQAESEAYERTISNGTDVFTINPSESVGSGSYEPLSEAVAGDNIGASLKGVVQFKVSQMSRREAFRQAKQDAGIPKSSQYKTYKYVYDGTSENRTVYEFTVDGKKQYIIEHAEDKMGRGPHFHGADDVKGSPFEKGRYNQYDGHYPEDFNGYKK